MPFPVVLPGLHIDGARVSCKTTRVKSATGANDVGFIVITGRMRAAEIKPPQHTRRCSKGDKGCVATFVNRTVVCPSVMHARPNLARKFIQERSEERRVGKECRSRW